MSIPVQTDLADLKLYAPDDLVVYRFVQESLTNIAKYAEATSVVVTLRGAAEYVDIEVRDNGVGFAKDVALPGRHGLAGMRFRVESLGGAMTIESAPGAGTVIQARLPLAEHRNSVGEVGGQWTVNSKLE